MPSYVVPTLSREGRKFEYFSPDFKKLSILLKGFFMPIYVVPTLSREGRKFESFSPDI